MTQLEVRRGISVMRAEQVAMDYAREVGANHETDHYSILLDLLADLMHYADEHGAKFNKALATARTHYENEKGNPK